MQKPAETDSATRDRKRKGNNAIAGCYNKLEWLALRTYLIVDEREAENGFCILSTVCPECYAVDSDDV